MTLASVPHKMEHLCQEVERPSAMSGYLCLEEFTFTYKDRPQTFWMANSWSYQSGWGEVALYPHDIDLTKICLGYPGSFSGIDPKGTGYYSCLRYEYPLNQTSPEPFVVLDQMNTYKEHQGRGYAKACLAYFLEKVMLEKTQCHLVIADARTQEIKDALTKELFVAGEAPDITYPRAPAVPVYCYVKEKPL